MRVRRGVAVVGAVVLLPSCSSCDRGNSAGVAAKGDAATWSTGSGAPTQVTAVEAAAAPFRPAEHVALLPSGHVLLASGEDVGLWKPETKEPPRHVTISSEPGVPVLVWMHPRSPTFVASRLTPDHVALSLWDAESLTEIKAVQDTWGDSLPMTSFSADGKRFTIIACAFVAPQSADCAVDIYTTQGGTLVHRTKLQRLETGPYAANIQLSPTGAFFGVSNEFSPSEVHESDTGKLVVRAKDRSEVMFHENSMRFLFVDERRLLLTSGWGGKMQVTDLPTGRVLRSVELHADVSADESSGHVLSADRTWVAVQMMRPAGKEIGVWNLADGRSATYSVPAHICKQYCDLAWSRRTELVVHDVEVPAANQWRLDVESGEQRVERFEPPPTFSEGGFEVFGDVDVRFWDGVAHTSTKWHGAGPASNDPRGLLVTRTGANVNLINLARSTMQVAGERFLFEHKGSMMLVNADGDTSTLDVR